MGLSKKLQKLLTESEKKTSKYKRLQINLALKYGTKEEIINAVRILIKTKKNFTEKNIEEKLYTNNS